MTWKQQPILFQSLPPKCVWLKFCVIIRVSKSWSAEPPVPNPELYVEQW